MTVAKLVELIGAKSGELSFWAIVLLILSVGVELTPIKFNPWSTILNWIGSKFNTQINAKLKDIDEKVNKLNNDLDKHIAESNEKEL